MRGIDLHERIDVSLSGLQWNKQDTKNVLYRIKKEEGIAQKRKIKQGILIPALLALLLIGTAIASGVAFPGIRQILGLEDNISEYIRTSSFEMENAFAKITGSELYSDGINNYLEVIITPKDGNLLVCSGAYGIAPNDPSTVLKLPDTTPDESVAQYAKRNGLTMIYTMFANKGIEYNTVGSTQTLFPNGDGSWIELLQFQRSETEADLLLLCLPLYEAKEGDEAPVTVKGEPAQGYRGWTYARNLEKKQIQAEYVLNLQLPEMETEQIEVHHLKEMTEARPMNDIIVEDARILKTPLKTCLEVTFVSPYDIDTASQITLTILDRAPEDMHNGSCQTAYSRTCGCITEPAGEGLYRTRYTCIINLDEYPDHEIWIWPTYSSQGCVHMVFD